MLMFKKVDAATFQTLLDMADFLQVCSSFGILWTEKRIIISAEEEKAQV